jgi:hypothetical protein
MQVSFFIGESGECVKKLKLKKVWAFLLYYSPNDYKWILNDYNNETNKFSQLFQTKEYIKKLIY